MGQSMDIKAMVAEGRGVRFLYYRLGELWYVTETGFEFPVPITDCGDGKFLAEDKRSFSCGISAGMSLTSRRHSARSVRWRTNVAFKQVLAAERSTPVRVVAWIS
jgi:hypothetical protein